MATSLLNESPPSRDTVNTPYSILFVPISFGTIHKCSYFALRVTFHTYTEMAQRRNTQRLFILLARSHITTTRYNSYIVLLFDFATPETGRTPCMRGSVVIHIQPHSINIERQNFALENSIMKEQMPISQNRILLLLSFAQHAHSPMHINCPN